MQLFHGQVRFGAHLWPQNVTFDQYLAWWQRLEALGFDFATSNDHLQPVRADPASPSFEGPTLLSALAARTTRLRCVLLVAGNPFRNPGVLAKIAATIDNVSGGRLELGLGAGWFEAEHRQFGIPFPPRAQRIRMMGEAAHILRSLWTQERTTFTGRFYTLRDAYCAPKPVQQPSIPLWIGGSGEQLTLRIVAESADGWNTFWLPEEDYRRKCEVLAGHCRDVGRDPGDIRRSLLLRLFVSDTEAEANDSLRSFAARTGIDERALRQQAIVGTPDRCVEGLLRYARLGVRDFIFESFSSPDWRVLELAAQKVVPVMKAEVAKL